MERDSRGQIILKVYLDNTEERTAEVPVTPDTTCADVIECCKEAGEEQCHLAELWRGCERVIALDERPFEILQQWGIHRDEVLFFLRHEAAAVLNNMQGRRIHKKNGLVEGSHNNSNMLPTGVDLTLSELQEMAARQQQQIETQQQILVAKEQRLKFLKQQEMRHHQIASENERLRKLREKVESQELKLKKLRALRGQVDQHKSNNVNFTSELEAIRGLFNEKEKELAVAVAKVEELTKQLEKVQRGNMHGNNSVLNTPAMMELEKLRKELAMRNKVNEQQNVKLNSTRQVLALKKDEVTMMDKRIAELQARLQKKRAMQQEQRNNLANQKRVASGSVSPQRSQSSNIAAVEPYIKHAPKDVSKDDMFSNQDLKAGFSLGKSDPKYQTLPYNTKFPIGDVGKKPEREQVNGNDNYHPEKPVSYSNTQSGVKVPSPNNNSQQIQNKEMKTNFPANFVTSADNMVTVNAAQEVIQTSAPQDAQVKNRYSFTVKAPTCFANFAPRPFGSTYSTALITNRNNAITTTVSNSQAVSSAVTQHGESNGQVPTVIVTGTSSATGKDETDSPVQTSMQQPLTVFITGSMTVSGPVSPQICTSSKGGPPIYKVSSRPTPLIQPQQTEVPLSPPQSPNNNNNIPDRVTVTPPRGPITSTPITQIQQINTPQTTFVDTPTSSNADNRPVPGQFTVTNSTKVSLSERQTLEVEPAVEPGQTAALLVQSEQENVPVAVLSSLSSDPHSAKEAVDTSPNAVSSALSVLMGSTTATTTTRPTYRYAPKSVIANTYMRKMGSSAIDQYRKNMAALYKDFYPHGDAVTNTETASSTADTSFPDPPHNTPVNSPSPVKQENIHNQNTDSKIPENSGRPEPPPYPGNTRGLSPHKTAPPPYPGPRALRRRLSTDDADLTSQTEQSSESSMQPGTRVSPQQEESPTKDAKSVVVMRVKKPTLKSKDSTKTVSRRVSFDPLALLLDASLEGELELVKRTAAEVPDPSAANDEGITALHNAICAGHYDIVKFLVEFGCDANAPDSDGWTPLHCAASCNNLPMVKFLVEHGACIFATTISDQETAAEKCEEDEDGYDGCSEYLYSIQEKLGILNNGLVYALFDYIAQNNDELEFHINDQLTVLRKGDDHERDWWWTRHKDREGYIPRNLLGLYPRVLPKKEGS